MLPSKVYVAFAARRWPAAAFVLLVLVVQAGISRAGGNPSTRAAKAETPLDEPLSLSVDPGDVRLDSVWQRAQLVLTGHYPGNRVRDLTRSALYSSWTPEVAVISRDGVITPRRPGHTVIRARVGAAAIEVPVSVLGGTAAAVSFVQDVVPTFTHAGCNSGACHGTPSGKNGFRLSLRGYDPASDYLQLTHDASSRRLDMLEPDASLLLMKPSTVLPHEGGRRLGHGGYLYELVRQWIGQGAPNDIAAAATVSSLEVLPASRSLEAPEAAQQLRVIAHFQDGCERDVTRLARFSVNDESVASVEPNGLVEKVARGEAAVAAEYMGSMATAQLIFLDHDSGISWRPPPENNYIDHYVFHKLAMLRVEPSPLAGDSEFLRRAYLDLTGELPPPKEVRRFLALRDPRKREQLIDALLESPEYVDWWAMKLTDRLGCNRRFVGQVGAYKYHEWIREAIADNMPEDEFARAVLTGRGGNYEHPPASFYRRLRDPAASGEEVAQLFLGVRLQCARCHNHPGERWTQDDYYGFAAFFARVRYKEGPYYRETYDKEESVYADRKGEMIHPRSGRVMLPKFLGGDIAAIGAREDRREVLARWLTSPKNPFFSKAAVNRIWYHLFGRGIVEPVDDMRSTNPASNEGLLGALAADFVEHNFDRKRLIRTIMCSRTYQLSSQTTPTNIDEEKYFAHARVRLLPAEAMLNAVCEASGSEEKFPGFPLGTSASALPDGEFKHPFLEAFGRPARAMSCECERGSDTNLCQALQLVGGRVVEDKIHNSSGRVARLLASGRPAGDVVEELFLATLSRYPTQLERKYLVGRLGHAKDRRRAVEDVLWALINHQEFIFQH
jgi:hypothetical protein